MSSPRERHQELAELLTRADHAYYVLAEPVMDDRAYDLLYRELVELERAHPELLSASSPTQRVGGAPIEGFAKVRREIPMLSLDNTYSEDELREWAGRVERGLAGGAAGFVVEPKIDGVSIELRYEHGRLVRGATRGDGETGDDVTHNVRTIRALPLVIGAPDAPAPPVLDVRGEVYYERAALPLINAEREKTGEEPVKNPRNGAAGTLKLLDPRVTARRPLKIFLYEIVDGGRLDAGHWDSLGRIRRLGLPTPPHLVRCESVEAILAHVHAFATTRRELPFDVDGLVIKVDRYAERLRLGATSKFPRWAIAYKYEAERATTVCRKVRVNVGRTGAIVPWADLEPVELSGTTVSRATLHNWDEVRRKGVYDGCTVLIQKAGEIIPQVLEVLSAPHDAQVAEPPTTCPSCGTALSRGEGEVALRCPNRFGCPAQLLARLEHFAGKGGLDIDGMGPALVAQLVEHALVRSPADLLGLDVARLVALERMGEKSADHVVRGIASAKTNVSLARLVTALGIPLVGGVAAETVARAFDDFAAFVAASPESLARLDDMQGVGPKIAAAVKTYLADPGERAILEGILAAGWNPQNAAPKDGPLVGLRIAITGTLSKSRDAYKRAIEAAGGQFSTSVTKGTQYLVAGENLGDAKRKAAEKHGTKIIGEAELETLLSTGSLQGA